MKFITASFLLIIQLTGVTVNAQVLQTSQSKGVTNGIESIRYSFEITADNIPTRSVRVVQYYHNAFPKGSILFTTGGYGGGFYSSQHPNCLKTVDTLWKAGFEVFEIKWDGDYGWGTNASGKGYATPLNAYSLLVRYLKTSGIISNPQNVMAQGNSGGGIQIAYGLALYGLEDILSLAILTGGPPSSDLRQSIFGNSESKVYWPNGLDGFALTDYLMGWKDNGDYCINRQAPDSIQQLLDHESLVSPTQSRDFHYQTRLHFIESNDPTAADSCGLYYYNHVQSEKEWHYLSQVKTHEVHTSDEGSRFIQDIFLNTLNPVEVGDEKVVRSVNTAYPNPSSGFIHFKKPVRTVEVFDILGRQVFLKQQGEFQQLTVQIPPGVYFVRYFSENQWTVQKMVFSGIR